MNRSIPAWVWLANSVQVLRDITLIFESRISDISNLGSSLTKMGGGGGWTQSGIGFGNADSSMETWNTGCTARKLSGSHRVTEWVPGCTRISYGPRNLSESFLDGQVVRKN